MDTVNIQLVLTDTYFPDRGPGITVQLVCGPDLICDYDVVDIGLDEPTIDGLTLRSCDDDAMREVGERLMAALQMKDKVRQALIKARALPQCPISLILAGQKGNRLPWETLFDPSSPGFLEFVGTMPMSRAVQGHQSGTSPALLERPRILAVLSAPSQTRAYGASGPDDWSYAELRQLTDAIDITGVHADLRVLTSELSVLSAADRDGVHAKQITDEESVTNEIESFDPHFLHFFCHGFDAPSPHLRLYRPSDTHTGKPQIKLDPDMVTKHIGCTCLVVLNSCSGAAEKQGTQSMAQMLVSKRFPVVIGMKEPIEWHDATRFTFALYRHMLEALRSSGTNHIDMRFLAALQGPRRALLSRFDEPVPDAAQQHREWTLPLVYTRPGGLILPVMSADEQESPSRQARREGEHLATRSVGNHLHPETPPEAVETLTRIADELTEPATEDEAFHVAEPIGFSYGITSGTAEKESGTAEEQGQAQAAT